MKKDSYINYLSNLINNYDLKQITVKGFYFCLISGFMVLATSFEEYSEWVLCFGFFAFCFIALLDFRYFQHKDMIYQQLEKVIKDKKKRIFNVINISVLTNEEENSPNSKVWFFSLYDFGLYASTFLIYSFIGVIILFIKKRLCCVSLIIFSFVIFLYLFYMIFRKFANDKT